MSELSFARIHWHLPDWLRFSPIIWLFALSVGALSWYWLPEGGHDWRNFFLLAGRNWWPDPWGGLGAFPYPPWASLLISPLAALPARVATVLTNTTAVLMLTLVIRRFDGPEWVVLPVLISPPGFWLFSNGQLDWLVWWGLLMFNGLDILLLTIKPQVAIGVVFRAVAKSSGD